MLFLLTTAPLWHTVLPPRIPCVQSSGSLFNFQSDCHRYVSFSMAFWVYISDLAKTNIKVSVTGYFPIGCVYEDTKIGTLFLLLYIVVCAHWLPCILFFNQSIFLTKLRVLLGFKILSISWNEIFRRLNTSRLIRKKENQHVFCEHQLLLLINFKWSVLCRPNLHCLVVNT